MNKRTIGFICIILSVVISLIIYEFAVIRTRIKLESKQSEYVNKKSICDTEKINYSKALSLFEELKNDKAKQQYYTRKLLDAGLQEANLMQSILACANDTFFIRNFDIGKSYVLKSDDKENEYNEPQKFDYKNVELDENGMPVGLEVDDGKWEGVEVLPVKIRFDSTYASLAKFMKELKVLPIHLIRSLDVNFVNSKRIRGTIILSFPLGEKQL